MGLLHTVRAALWRGVSLLPLPLLLACVAARPTRVPIPHEEHLAPAGPHRILLVLLPGIRDTQEDFVRHGFVAAVRDRGLPVDVVTVDAHLGYYTREMVAERLLEDVIRPARERGVRRVVLAGVSLGGLGSLVVTERYPEQVDGLLLLAPFLGGREVLEEIAAAGGPSAWTPPEIASDDFQRGVWRWLQGADLPPAVVGVGGGDRYVAASRMLAELLPPGRLVEVPGGHDWRTWKPLWERLLDGPEIREAGVFGDAVAATPPRP